jgi:hypothetical protein
MNNKIKSSIVKQIVLAFKNSTKSIPPMKVLLLLISLFLYDITNATTYFISSSGNDATGNGTTGNPWKTLVKATQTVTTPGDIIYVNSGTYTETSQCNLAAGVSIEGNGVTSIIKSTLTADWTSLLYVGSAEGTNGNQHISNLKFDGSNLSTFWGIEVAGRKNVSIYNCTIENFKDRGVIFAGRTDGALSPPTIYATGNTFHDNIINNSGQYNGYGRACLNIGGQDGMLIYNNVITQNQRAVGSNGWCIKGYNDGFLRNVKIYNNTLTRIAHAAGDDFDFAIELFFLEGGNEVYNNTIQGSFDTNFQSIGSSTYSLWIHDNTFSLPSFAPVVQHGIILEFDSDGVIIENNTFTNITKCITFFPRNNVVKNITIRKNLLKNIGGENSGHFIGGFESEAGDFDVSNFFVYNNTMISSTSSPVGWGLNLGGVNAGHGYNNVQVKNNIFQNTTAAWMVCGSLDKMANSNIQYNDAFGNGNSDDPNPSWIGSPPLAGSSVIANNLKVNPVFANTSTYTLGSASTLIDAGINVGLAYIGAAPDMGYAEYASGGNTAPTANAGADQSITLPLSNVSLTGTGTDTDGTIAAYAWTKISGPAGNTITTPAAAATTITGLLQGVYVFRLTVTDNAGATGFDNVQIIVFAPNIAPTANAGLNQSITLPTNIANLSGSGTDVDGSIITYNWTKIAGPATGTITSPNTPATSITGLTQGIYQFELRVTDNSGATDTDTVQVTVNPENLPPVANAGIDQSIVLPSNKVTLSGSGTDADGFIISYSWRQISGPADKLTSLNTAVTVLDNLIAGSYKFELTVTDNKGAKGKDSVNVDVSTPFLVIPAKKSIKNYPNPVVDFTMLDINSTIDNSVLLIVVTDMQGKSVYKKQLITGSYTTKEKINMSNFTKGIYMITVYFSSEEKLTIKAVKL